MGIKALGRKLSEAELYAPDLDEGVLDVEHYLVPQSDSKDDYLREVWNEAARMVNAGEVTPESEEEIP